jgi:2-methylcitrate dehydratase PrpD
MVGSSEALTRTERLAAAAARFSPDTLPADVLKHAKNCLLDHVAVALYGMRQPWTRFVLDMVRRDGGSSHSSIYGEGIRVPSHAAALVNGTAAHGFELDDWHIASGSHLGAAVIPAVLAVAERERSTGRDVLSAIVAGYEVMGRVGKAAMPSLIMRGFHPTGTQGPIGAAAGVANLLKVSAATMTDALGIAASCGAGLMEFCQVEKGTMVKRLHAGRAAQAGVMAVDLAMRGLTSPHSSLDGRFGYCRTFSDAPNLAALDDALGEDFAIRHNNFKPYACCGMLHSSIDAIVDLMARHKLTVEDVDEVVIGASQAMVEQHSTTAPESVMAAQYSMPYSASVALLGRALDPRAFDEGAYRDPRILSIARSVRLEVDPSIEELFPAKFGASVRVRVTSGEELRSTVEDARGTTGNPLTREALIAKARGLCEGIVAPAILERIIESVLRFEEVSDTTHLLQLLDTSR